MKFIKGASDPPPPPGIGHGRHYAVACWGHWLSAGRCGASPGCIRGEEGGGGVWDPKVCASKMVRQGPASLGPALDLTAAP